MSVKRSVGVGLVVLGAWLVACGGSSGGGSSASDEASFADQFCATFTPCCQQANRPSDGAVCRAFVSAAGSGKTYDPVKGGACIDQMRAAAAKPDFCSAGLGDASAPDCEQAFRSPPGTAAPGAACKEESDCAPSQEGDVDCRSAFTSGAESRFCQVQIKGKENDTPCLGTRDGNVTMYAFSSSSTGDERPARGYICDVADGLRCDSKSRACTRIADVGGACDGTSDACVKTAYCDAVQKKCVARLADGSPCGANGVPSDVCLDRSFCDTTSKTCTPGLADGAPCTRSESCASRRCLNGACEPSSGSSFSLALLCGGG